ncbi:diguanylate cyclase [Noviherbaspirillum sp. CPCC 100848]|uniref:Diguanylate cyclase n=1 Tax=Noviherbaspirillum album TaxID=3080276 RepID=A0ABU6JKH2_9BURK|nr:diguanylate cyclase [Noviherbaspirillum sp. CPCC 100848]
MDDLHDKIAELVLDTIFIVDVHGHINYVSPSCFDLLSYTQQELTGRKMIDLVLLDDRAKTLDESLLVMSGVPRVGFENRYVRADGSVVDIMWSARWSPEHQVRIGVARNVTTVKRQLAMQQAMYEISNAAHTVTELKQLYPKVRRILHSILPTSAFALALHDEQACLALQYQLDFCGDAAVLQAKVGKELCTLAAQSNKVELHGGSKGEPFWLAAPISRADKVFGVIVIRSHAGTVLGQQEAELLSFIAAQLSDAIERHRLHAELIAAATTDELTGLPNRRLFVDRAEAACRAARRHGHHFALLYVDVDRFKAVNDTYGHEAGDELLKQVARRLSKCVREEDTVARLGGDEFVILLPGVHQQASKALQEKIQAAFKEEFVLPTGVHVTRDPSIGLAVYPEDGDDVTALTRAADKRMYANKWHRSMKS